MDWHIVLALAPVLAILITVLIAIFGEKEIHDDG